MGENRYGPEEILNLQIPCVGSLFPLPVQKNSPVKGKINDRENPNNEMKRPAENENKAEQIFL